MKLKLIFNNIDCIYKIWFIWNNDIVCFSLPVIVMKYLLVFIDD